MRGVDDAKRRLASAVLFISLPLSLCLAVSLGCSPSLYLSFSLSFSFPLSLSLDCQSRPLKIERSQRFSRSFLHPASPSLSASLLLVARRFDASRTKIGVKPCGHR